MPYLPTDHIERQFLRDAAGEVASANERTILRHIWESPGIARSELVARSNLTQQSVHRIVEHLGDRGLLSFGPPKPGLGRGQPSPTLKLNGDYAYCWGISVTTDLIGLSLMDFSGKCLATEDVPFYGQSLGQALDQIRETLAAMTARLALDTERHFGIGFAIAGYFVDGTRFNASLPLHEWSLIELGPLLNEKFDKPTWVHNGANTGAIAEAMFGIGRHVHHFAYMSFNYGFGGGLISNGELLVGGNGNAGEFSQMFFPEEMKQRPALENLLECLQKAGVEVPSLSYLRQHFSPDWPGAQEWITAMEPGINRLINGITAVFDPQAIVFGGQVPSRLAEALIAHVRHAGEARYGVARQVPKLIISKIPGDASSLGASIVPFKESFF